MKGEKNERYNNYGDVDGVPIIALQLSNIGITLTKDKRI